MRKSESFKKVTNLGNFWSESLQMRFGCCLQDFEDFAVGKQERKMPDVPLNEPFLGQLFKVLY